MNNQQLNNTNANDLNIYDFLLYFGGFTLFLGFYYFIMVSWDEINPLLQILFTLVISFLLLFVGYSLVRQNLSKLGFPLIFISLFLTPVGGYVLSYNINEYFLLNFVEFYFYIFAFLLSALVFNFVYLRIKSTFLLTFTFIYYSLFYGSFVLNLATDFYSSKLYLGFITSSLIFLGLSGMFLSRYYLDKNKFIFYFLEIFSINFLLMGGWFFNFFLESKSYLYSAESGENVAWFIFYPMFTFILLNIAIRYKDIVSKIFSIIYLIIYVLYVLFRFLDSEYYFATLLLILGSSLIGTGYYQYIKKMKSDSIQNSSPQK